MQKLKTIILAAGKGARMKSDVPKVLHKVCGTPILQYVLDVAKSVGSLKSYVVVGHKSQLVEDFLPEDCIAVHQEKLLGTADAIRCTEKYLKNDVGNVLILCGDTPLLDKSVIRQLVRRHKKVDATCTFLTTVLHDPAGYGRIIRDTSGKAVAIREEKDAEGYEKGIAEINVGVYCIKAKALFQGLKDIKLNSKKKEFYLTDLIGIFNEQKIKVETVETENPLQGLGVNTKEDLAEAEKVMREKILQDLMLEGVTIQDPLTTYIDSSVKIGKDTIIRPFTFIEQGVVIGSKCIIGPFSRLRPGTKLGDGVEIGNFTEVSRSKLGNKVIMKHFSYLGDAVVGELVNIGAGSITANYDGKEKNKTHINQGAFIGSGSVIVAPATIGKKAIIGAGSVVTKKKRIPDGAVAFGVPAKVKK